MAIDAGATIETVSSSGTLVHQVELAEGSADSTRTPALDPLPIHHLTDTAVLTETHSIATRHTELAA